MQKYKNGSLDKISKKYQDQDFNDLEGVFVFPVGEVCDKLGINAEFIKLDKGKSGLFLFDYFLVFTSIICFFILLFLKKS